MPNFKRIGGGPWKPSVDLTWNDPRDNVRFSQMPTSPKFHYFGFAYVNAKIVIRTVFVKAIDRLLYDTKIVAAYG